jgi:hypothetical protein
LKTAAEIADQILVNFDVGKVENNASAQKAESI